MPRLPDETLSAIARELAAVLDARAPGWTSHQQGDPGITLLELMAFLTDTLAYRQTSAPEKRRATEVIARLQAVAAECVEDTLERVQYFEGRLLTASDLTDDQQYHRSKLARALLALHGAGIVEGLDVQVENGDDDSGTDISIRVEPGAAITPAGELLLIEACRRCRVRADGEDGVVFLTYTERETASAPALPVSDDAAPLRAARIEEGVGVGFAAAAAPGSVVVARVLRTANGWQIDRSFSPSRP